ncbi:MAG TPA: DASS family sodium-coupled anion symporter [Longimicrobiaceae bacterium]|nr:DASS family sodium-coupled anion symporter [Longimicrobiaceae bacterium]
MDAPRPAAVTSDDVSPRLGRLGLILGPLLFAALLLLPPPAGLSAAGWRAAAVGALMAVWWVTEAAPIPATSLLPLVLFPALGVAPIDAAAAPYANPLIFLFLGGFLLAAAMQRWGLHRRIALTVVGAMGTRPASLVGGFMAATALISMWVNNTATAMMMLPIGLSVVELVRPDDEGDTPRNFAPALMLGIGYAATLGGFGTLIGTAPNALFAGFMRETYGYEVPFVAWMAVGVPMVVVTTPLCWLILTRLVYPLRGAEVPGGRALIRGELRALGRVTRAEVLVALVFGSAALLWIFRPLLERWLPEGVLSDAGVAVGAALLLFLLPSGEPGRRVLDWEAGRSMPWDLLLLFGGGLSLADALTKTGLAAWLGDRLAGFDALPTPVLVLLVVVVIVLLSELASNTATAAAFLPVAGALALGVGENPLLLAIPATLAASCGFMLPVATPPNAIAYGTGHVSMRQMLRAGAWLDVACALVILAVSYTAMLWAFGIGAGVVPAWAR